MAIRAHVEWLNEGVTRWNRRRKKVHFLPDLSGVTFFDHLPHDFRDAPKTSRYFERIDLSGANLSNSDLSHLNFRKANFENANLRSADMSLSNFDEAYFETAILSGANGTNSSFRGAEFIQTTPQEMVLEEAQFEGASFIGVDLPRTLASSLTSRGAEFYSTMGTYKESRYTAKSVQSDYALGATKPKPIDDGKTQKNKYDVFFGTNRKPIIE